MMRWISGLTALFLCSQSWAATCKVSEYANLVTDANGRVVPVAIEPAIATQTVTYTASTELGADFSELTKFVRIICDAKAHFVFSRDGTNATASSPYVAADTPEYFGIESVQPGQTQTLNVDFYDGTT